MAYLIMYNTAVLFNFFFVLILYLSCDCVQETVGSYCGQETG